MLDVKIREMCSTNARLLFYCCWLYPVNTQNARTKIRANRILAFGIDVTNSSRSSGVTMQIVSYIYFSKSGR